ncbi:MAG: hypothetical protein AB1798_00910 [Spirochaetota bacterium]
MRKQFITFFLFFVISSPSVFAFSVDFYFHTDLETGIVIEKETRFSAKPQLKANIYQGLTLFLGNYFAVESGVGCLYVNASSLSGGVVYRGFTGIMADLRLLGRFPWGTADTPVKLWPGMSLAAAGYYARYWLTESFFFFPALTLQPLLDFLPGTRPPWFFRLGLPFTVYFRKDLIISAATGLSLSISYNPFALLRKKHEKKQ